MDSNIKELQNIIDNSRYTVFFGGAGISTESGIPDFRGKQGIYKKDIDTSNPFVSKQLEYKLSTLCMETEPSVFFDFYRENMDLRKYEPNIIHKKLAKFEKDNKLKAVITQNVDGLHQKAGSKNVIEIHGSIYNNSCTKCNKQFGIEYVMESTDIPRCPYCRLRKAIIKPGIILYGEKVPQNQLDKAINHIKQADVLIVAGTSLSVNPAADLIKQFNGSKSIFINNEKANTDFEFNIFIKDNIANVFKQLS